MADTISISNHEKYVLIRNTYCIHIYNYNVIEVHYMGNRAIYIYQLHE